MRKHFWILLVLLAALPLAGSAAAPRERVAPVGVITLEGAIDVPSAEYLERALRLAEKRDDQCLLILLNTPGGLMQPMQDMTEALLNAPIPSIVYVYPAGASAFSAGTFVTLAANIAAMHPATTIGAAHPVSLFPVPELPEPQEEKKPVGEAPKPPGPQPEEKTQPSSQDVMTEKLVNAFALQARVIAEQRGHNAAWAEKAVRQSATLSARDAVKERVVDLTAEDVPSLLAEVDGRKVTLPGNRSVVLRTKGAPLDEIPASAKERFLHVLADPNILLVLLVLAGLGILFELQNPGAILPGVVGGLCLLLALYSMAVLPVNYAGVGLIIFGMLLLLAEVKIASHGVLAVGGVTSFVIGALMLMDTSLAPALTASWQVIVVLALLLVGFFLFVVGAAVRAHMRKVSTGEEGLMGGRGRALTDLSPAGSVFVEGERWKARSSDGNISAGEGIQVIGQDGFVLIVKKSESAAAPGR